MKGKCQIDKGFIKVRFSHASVPTKAMVQGPKMEVTEGQEIHSVVERVGPWFRFLYVTWWRPCGCWLHLLDWPVLAAPCPTMGRLPAKFDLKPLNHTTICIYIYHYQSHHSHPATRKGTVALAVLCHGYGGYGRLDECSKALFFRQVTCRRMHRTWISEAWSYGVKDAAQNKSKYKSNK